MFEQLEIIRLGQQGDQKRRISCLVGRVSVFRSTSESELELYINALRGENTADRFSLLLDGHVFDPKQHHFIGFGETFSAEDPITVGEYLAQAGYSAEEIEQTALTHGLGGLSRARVAELAPGQARILRVLAATAKNDHVMIVNEPFDDVPDSWREALAERIVRYAWKYKAIVLVTRLSYRPECWVENEFITRIPLQRPRQHTIGMGGGEFSSQNVVAGLREQLNKQNTGPSVLEIAASSRERAADTMKRKLEQRAGTHLTASPLKPEGFKFQRAIATLGGVAAFLVLAIFVVVKSNNGSSTVTPITNNPTPSVLANNNKSPRSGEIGSQQNNPGQGTTSPNAGHRTTVANPQTALDEYPEEIRRAVLQAANEPDVLLRNVAATTKLRISPRLTEDKPMPLPIPMAEPTVTEPTESDQPVGDLGREMTEDEIQTRREEIRRKFLEAIQRQAGFGG